jgi:DNA modification methylase
MTDRFTRSHEYIFLLTKNKEYFFDNTAAKEKTHTQHDFIIDTSRGKMNHTPGRTPYGGMTHNNYAHKNKRSVWTVATEPYHGAHFAVYPEELITPCVLTSTKKGDIILDPFAGSGVTAKVAKHYGRRYLGCELNEDACRHLQEERINGRSSKLRS